MQSQISEKFIYELVVPISELGVPLNMITLTSKEQEIMLKLFKDFSQDYNANSLSKKIKITPRGALKILKKLEQEKILIGKKLGKAVFYRLNLEDEYVSKIIETILIAESREKAERWINEFKDVFKLTNIVIIFGSIIKNPKKASDTDVLFVFEKKNYNKVAKFVSDKNKIMFKKIHNIPQTMEDLIENLEKKNPAIMDAIKTGYVLNGTDKIIEIIKNVIHI